MHQAKPVVLELYATIANIDSSYLKMNWSLRHLKLQIELLRLDRFERQFRSCFHLPPCTWQDQLIPYSPDTATQESPPIVITKELHDLLLLSNSPYKRICQGDNVFFFKKVKTLMANEADSAQNLSTVAAELEQFQQLLGKIENNLRLIRYGSFGIQSCFACADGKPVLFDELPFAGNISHGSPGMPYEVKDNYLLKLLLSADNKMAGYVQLAIQNFYESFRIVNPEIRFINLVSCLEICFCMPHLIANDHIISRHAAMLITSGKEEFYQLYEEVLDCCRLKRKLMEGTKYNDKAIGPAILEVLPRTEELVRLTLKKIIKLNIRDKEKLFNLLNQGYSSLRHLAARDENM